MGIFSNIFRRRGQRRSEGEAPATEENTSGPSLVRVTQGVDEVTSADLALRIATVYRCIDILSKGVAQLPLEVKHNLGGYYKAEIDDIFGLNYLLTKRANERLSAFELKRSMMVQVLLQGNAYIVPVWGGDRFEKMCLCSPNSCIYDEFTNTYSISDTVNRLFGVFAADDVIHIKNFGTDGGYMGMSTLAYASKVMAITSNADAANIETFKSGGTLQGFVSGKDQGIGFGVIKDNQLSDVAKNIQEQLDSGRKIFNLPGEMSFSQISLSPKDIELLSSKQFNVMEICRFFGVHPDKVFAQQTTNYKASEMSQVSFLTDTLQPLLTQIELEFESKLIPRSLYGVYKMDFDIEPLMQTDLETQANYMTKTLAAGARTVNEWRKRLGNEPVDGGDEVLVSANLIPLGSKKLRGE